MTCAFCQGRALAQSRGPARCRRRTADGPFVAHRLPLRGERGQPPPATTQQGLVGRLEVIDVRLQLRLQIHLGLGVGGALALHEDPQPGLPSSEALVRQAPLGIGALAQPVRQDLGSLSGPYAPSPTPTGRSHWPKLYRITARLKDTSAAVRLAKTRFLPKEQETCGSAARHAAVHYFRETTCGFASFSAGPV